VDGLGVENIVDGFGVVTLNGEVPLVTEEGVVFIDTGVSDNLAVVVCIVLVGVVDLVSKYGRYPVGWAVVDFVKRNGR